MTPRAAQLQFVKGIVLAVVLGWWLASYPQNGPWVAVTFLLAVSADALAVALGWGYGRVGLGRSDAPHP